jgi:hypothetical protein
MAKKAEKNRKDDSLGKVPRPFVFVMTLIATILLTILFLYQTGMLQFHQKEKSESKQIVIQQPPQPQIVNIPDYSDDIEVLVDELNQLDGKYQKLQAAFIHQQQALQAQKIEAKKTVEKPENSPIEVLNQMMISYNEGGNMQMILQYIVPYLETDTIQDYFQRLVDITDEEGSITRFELVNRLDEAINLPPKMIKQPHSAERGFKEILSDLIVVRKKGENTDEVTQHLIQLKENVLKNHIRALGDIYSSELLSRDDRLDDLNELLRTYMMQQQLLFAFKTQYLHHHLRQIE